MVGLHIQHVFDGMAEMTDPGTLEIVQDHGNIAPLHDFTICYWVIVERAQNNRRRLLAHADGHAGKFWHGADIIIAQLHVRGDPGIIQRLEWLESDQDHGDVQSTDDRTECRRRGVREHVAEYQVEIGGLEFGQKGVG